jgi:ankyrin repeat protein
MIQKYYSIKTDTAIDDIVQQPRQQRSGATKEQHYISRDGASSVHWACYNGDVSALEKLLHQQKDDEVRDMVGRTALFYAACRGHIDCCALLMDHHDDWIDIGDRKGDTPLHVASFYQHTGVGRRLRQSAAAVNSRNKHGYAPLLVAMDVETVGLLVEFSADVMAVDKKGRTPLFCACAEKRESCVRYYCESAHEHLRLIDLADHRGDTPLHAASCNGHTRIVVMLVGSAANVNAKNVRGMTPIELARGCNNPECVAVLEPHSQQVSSSSSSSSSSRRFSGPQTPKGQQAAREVYQEQASMEHEPHAGWGGMSERGSQPTEFTSGMHVVSGSERAGYDDGHVDPGLARLMAAVSTPGREEEGSRGTSGEEEQRSISKLESIVGMGAGVGVGAGGTTLSTMERLAAAVNGGSPVRQQQQSSSSSSSSSSTHWVSSVDPQSGSMYFKELMTGHTQWEPPSGGQLVNKEWSESGGVWTNVRTLEQRATPG